jgi:hypothetical protein
MEKKWYRLYIHSVGGGTECEGPFEYTSEKESDTFQMALEEAYRMSVEDYESFEGYHGIPDIGDIMEDKEEYGLDEDADEDACWEVYYEQRESWLNYWVVDAEGPDDIDEDYQ